MYKSLREVGLYFTAARQTIFEIVDEICQTESHEQPIIAADSVFGPMPR